MEVAGLFAGIGGIERGLGRNFHPILFCENDRSAQAVLRHRFGDIPIESDIATLRSLPRSVDVVTAGFPCTDLSQAGRTQGIRGAQSGLVDHVFRLIDRSTARRIDWLIIENVKNMLVLAKGEAMRHLVEQLEDKGFAWAYRVVDTRAFGLPQRRQRVILVASRRNDPGAVLFADDAGEPAPSRYRLDAFGFYWTEGLRGLGWAVDATPTLKGGSSIGIPSPPAIWLPLEDIGRNIVTPTIVDAERLQGFPAGWTDVALKDRPMKHGQRWKMVGNAVSVPVARWLGRRLTSPGEAKPYGNALMSGNRWPLAACGTPKGRRSAVDVSMWPVRHRYRHLSDAIDISAAMPLTHRAAAGFLSRLERGHLRTPEDFRLDMKKHVSVMQEASRLDAIE